MLPVLKTRARIEAQGFLGLDDQTVNQINYWLRLSPAICMAWVAIGTALQSAGVLWWLVPFAALGAILPGHPFDILYTYGFRYLTSGPRLPCYPLPRTFRLSDRNGNDRRCGVELSDRATTDGTDLGLDIGDSRLGQCEHRVLYPFVPLWSDIRQTVIVRSERGGKPENGISHVLSYSVLPAMASGSFSSCP